VLFDDLERWLAEITGFDAISLQPNAGSQCEYVGLLVIREIAIGNVAKQNSDRNCGKS
jgi:glycine dehydrogenase